MNVLDVATQVIDALDQGRTQYMLVGSLSSNVYGIPRNTNDADFVLSSQAAEIAVIQSILGGGYQLDPQISFESTTMTTRRVITHLETGFLLEFFGLSTDPHDVWRFGRRRPMRLLDREVYIPTVEDVVITKLRWAKIARRSKDILDIQGIFAVQHPRNIDMACVRRWTDLHGTTALLEQLLAQTTRAEMGT